MFEQGPKKTFFIEFTRYKNILTKNAQSMDTPELKLESGMAGDYHVPFGGGDLC